MMIYRFMIRASRKFLLPSLPKKYQLPLKHWIHLKIESYENELKYLNALFTECELAIDVGANEGLFSYVMSKHFEQVYSFEVNEELTQSLAAYNPGNIKLFPCGLSSKSSQAKLYIPVIGQKQLRGWASLDHGNCPDASQHVEKDVELITLDELELESLSFIKIDVEGHELEVLRGAYQTLKRFLPNVLIEIKDKNLDDVFLFFEELGYSRYKLEHFVDAQSSRENYIFMSSQSTARKAEGKVISQAISRVS